MTTMTQERWNALSAAERDTLRSEDGLTPQLKGCEGWRVEVETTYGETRRFIVGRSTGWKPCHIELKRVDSHSGIGAERAYKSVTRIERVR